MLWTLNADTSVPNPIWNNDWDGAPLVIDDHLLQGGENSWFYVIRLNRDYDRDGLVTVDPEVVLTVPGYDDQLFASVPDSDFSIENSVAFRDGVAYFANSGGLVQGWDISRVLRGGKKAERVFRFWTGDDTDASVVIDEEGFLYVASEHPTLQRAVGGGRAAHEARPDEARGSRARLGRPDQGEGRRRARAARGRRRRWRTGSSTSRRTTAT